MSNPKIPIIALLILLAAAASFAAGPVPVANGPEPRDGRETWRLEEMWRAGHEDDDVFFGLITRVVAGPQGNIHLLDSQMNTVHVYSPDGDHLRTLFREGEGPGEVRSSRDMTVFSDGRVGVLQEMPGSMTFVDADGTPAGSVKIRGPELADAGIYTLFACFLGGDSLVLSGTEHVRDRPEISRRINFLSSFDDQGAETHRFAELVNSYDFSDFVFDESVHIPGFWWNSAVDRAGRVFTVPDLQTYEILVFAADGSPVRTITRDYEPYMRSGAEKDVVRRMIDSAMANSGVPYRVEVMDAAPAVNYIMRGLRIHDDGDLWVLPWRGVVDQPEGVLATFDVFDPQGVFVRQVSLACPGDGEIDGVFAVGPDRFVVIRGYAEAVSAQFGGRSRASDDDGDEALMEIVCYRVAR